MLHLPGKGNGAMTSARRESQTVLIIQFRTAASADTNQNWRQSRFVQISPTFRSIVLITVSIFPLNTCLARLRVKPVAVWKGTCDGSDRAKGSTTTSTT